MKCLTELVQDVADLIHSLPPSQGCSEHIILRDNQLMRIFAFNRKPGDIFIFHVTYESFKKGLLSKQWHAIDLIFRNLRKEGKI